MHFTLLTTWSLGSRLRASKTMICQQALKLPAHHLLSLISLWLGSSTRQQQRTLLLTVSYIRTCTALFSLVSFQLQTCRTSLLTASWISTSSLPLSLIFLSQHISFLIASSMSVSPFHLLSLISLQLQSSPWHSWWKLFLPTANQMRVVMKI